MIGPRRHAFDCGFTSLVSEREGNAGNTWDHWSRYEVSAEKHQRGVAGFLDCSAEDRASFLQSGIIQCGSVFYWVSN